MLAPNLIQDGSHKDTIHTYSAGWTEDDGG